MKGYQILTVAMLLACTPVAAKAPEAPAGAISAEMLQRMRANYSNDATDRAVRNALAGSDIDVLAASADAANGFDKDFSHRVKSKGITDQKSSGRCWLFTGLNVIRAQMMSNHNLPQVELSQNYNFFYDQLEKSNLFLQGIIDYAARPMDDKMVDWLFEHPLSDGGTYSGVASNLMKYGVVPSDVMKETYQSNNTSKLSRLIGTKLREDGLELRRMAAAKAKPAALAKRKEEMLSEIYGMLSRALGTPPTEFYWTQKDDKGEVVSRKKYTPQEFYKLFVGTDLKNDYVMLMNDPSREYYKLYEIDFDRHAYDGENWKYINLPADDIKKMAIESIKGDQAMYFSCDVGKYLSKTNGTLDLNNYDYESLMGVKFGMDKAQRICTHASASSHAMTLVAVDLDEQGKPLKWMVENSWGPGANDGHLIMTDKWFDEYMFRVVVDKKYVPADILDILKQKPTMLPAWDPMF